jgi:hypothetical protein
MQRGRDEAQKRKDDELAAARAAAVSEVAKQTNATCVSASVRAPQGRAL